MSRRGKPGLSHHDRTAERPDAAGREHGAEVRRAPVELVLDEVGQQHLDRAHEEQVGERGAHEGAPQPYAAAHEGKAGLDVADERGALRGHEPRPRGHREQAAARTPRTRSRRARTPSPRPRPRSARRRGPGPRAAAPAGARTGRASSPARAPTRAGCPARSRRRRGRRRPGRRRTPPRGPRCARSRAPRSARAPPSRPRRGREPRPRPASRGGGRSGRSPRRRSAGTRSSARSSAIPTTASAAGAFERTYTCHAMATRKTPSPSREAHMPHHNSRKSRCFSGTSSRTRLKPPGRSSPS